MTEPQFAFCKKWWSSPAGGLVKTCQGITEKGLKNVSTLHCLVGMGMDPHFGNYFDKMSSKNFIKRGHVISLLGV